jgi:hypothetical protein
MKSITAYFADDIRDDGLAQHPTAAHKIKYIAPNSPAQRLLVLSIEGNTEEPPSTAVRRSCF